MRSTLLATAALLAVGCASASPASASDHGEAAAPAVDFTQALPADERVGRPTALQELMARHRNGYGVEGRVLYRTPPVEAPRRFDLVGVAGEMHALEFRARTDGGGWSDWVESDNGDPVYTGGSDEVQLRSRGVPIEGELHYVRLGTPAPFSRPAPAARRGSRGGSGRRIAPKPKFIGRATWGANSKEGGCIPRESPVRGRVKAGVIHHTVTTNEYSEAEAAGIVLGICRYHRNANGWNDIGYNALVDRFGNLYQGRAGGMNRAIVGAQAEGHNSQTTGVATIATHTEEKAAGPERRGLISYLAWKLDLHGVAATGRTSLTSTGGSSTRTPDGERIRVFRILSHSDTNFTECAGTELRAQIPGIRAAVQRRIDDAGGGDPVDPDDPPTDPGGGGAAPRGR